VADLERLKPLQHVAAVRERDAAQSFGESTRRLQEEEARLEELQRYHGEYLERFRALQQQGMTVAQLLEYQAFLAKLQAAVGHQEEIVRLRQAEAARRRADWSDRRTRTRVMDRAVENLAEAEQKADERRDQKSEDDRNQRRR
jgi:flagellar FliJ protein